MIKSIKWRATIVAAVILICILFLLPTITSKLPSWWKPNKPLGLGLDLKGGIHLVYDVDLDVALKNTVTRNMEDLRFKLADEKINFIDAKQKNALEIELSFAETEDLNSAKKLVADKFGNLIVKTQDASSLVLTLSTNEIADIKSLTLRQALETIRNRIDMFGVAEVDVRPQGEDRIVLQVPGFDDPERAKEIIGKTALLEFRLVDGTMDPNRALEEGIPFGSEILYGNVLDPRTGQTENIPYLVEKKAALTGEALTDARVRIDGQFNEPLVSINFDKRGARVFERLTGDNIDRRLAIVLDDQVYSAPNINSKISGGEATITGTFTLDEASDLAVILRAGSLPAPINVLEERTVGPSLGSDSIKQGLMAGLVGIGLIFVFLIIYYRYSGIVASIALFTNFIIILAVLTIFGANLTLPGIFGLILTLGMAIDANVLIFERIREELRAHKTPKEAVHNGFARAFATIIDSNLTSLITALVLFQFGTGPIRGFAITLSIGLLASMFTAVFFSRIIFDYVLTKYNVKRISI